MSDLSRDLLTLPSDWRLVRVGGDKAPIAGKNWFDRDNYSPDDAATLNGSSPPAWGLKSGPSSGGVLVLDLDAEGWRESFLEVTGHPITDLPRTIGWTSGKPERSGHAFTVDPDWWEHLANRRAWCNPAGETAWELRWNRCQSVIIGAHPETGAYRWLPGRSPADIPDPAPAPDWLLEALLIQEHPDAEPVAPTAEDAARAVAMLQWLPAADFTSYDDWLGVGMALHHTDPGLLTAWRDWSAGMANFDEAELVAKWESFGKGHKGRPATIATLHHLAKQHGYKEPRRSRRKEPAPPVGGDTAAATLPTSFAALIDSLPDGWIYPKEGPPTRCKLAVGDFSGMLQKYAGHLLRLNEMTLLAEVHTAAGWVQINDGDLDSISVQMSEKGWTVGLEPSIRAALHVARKQRFHPVRDYLLSIEKDPAIEPYDLDKVAPDFFRAKESLHVAMVRKWLIGAVARAMVPGCQMDYCLVLQGGQGIGKSTALRALATPELSCSSVPDNDKDLIQTAHSCWIYELAELDSVMSRREAGRLKNLISTPRDRIRLPYGRTTQEMKRGSVFAATVNESEFLNDSTGSRRYWVVPIDGAAKLDRDKLKANRDRIWKAALAAHRAGELPMLSDHDATASEEQNEQFRHDDAWLALLQSWVCGEPVRRSDADGPASVSPDRPFSTAAAIISAGLRRSDQINRADETRVAPLLRQLGFEKGKQQRVEGERVRLWHRAT